MKSFLTVVLLELFLGHSRAFLRPSPTVENKSSLFASSGGGSIDGESRRRKAVVVGGGPVGLATALTLSNAPHYYDITLVEQAPQASGYDPTKAYLYLVNPRGQVWTKKFPRVQDLLIERGSLNTGMGNFITVPGDPSLPIPEKVPASRGEASYWISRHTMVELLEQVIQEQEQERQNKGINVGSIQIFPCQQFLKLKTIDNDRLEVIVADTRVLESRFQQSYPADLVVGADGMNSGVRSFLANPPRDGERTWLTANPKKFITHAWSSAASGLRMKVLQFPPAFVIPPDTQTNSETIYAIRSINTGPKDYISLGLLPVKDPDMVRPTNVITRPNHDVWNLRGGQEIKAWFKKAFPRLDLDKMIDDKEWERFASAKGTTFPKCQYCDGMQITNESNTGVVLVGDAIHAFPPDIGQGINAGLADVVALDRALVGQNLITGEETNTKPQTLAQALETYEKIRAPEIRALIRLSRFGSPYQYRQPLYRDRIGRTLWTMNVGLRMMLNKLVKTPPPAIMSAMDKRVTYRQLMRRADITTVALWSIVAVVVQRLLGTVAMLTGSVLPISLWFFTYWFGK